MNEVHRDSSVDEVFSHCESHTCLAGFALLLNVSYDVYDKLGSLSACRYPESQ